MLVFAMTRCDDMPNNANLTIDTLSITVINKLQLLHVVRRYGPVGGMERYVWELTLQLQKLGHQVVVICEHCYAEKPEGIIVIELGEIVQRPHWMSALRFDHHVVHWLKKNPYPNRLIHSHERISSHDITTFHSPPFATIFEKPWWKLVSLRVAMKLYLERRELSKARSIVPNSHFIKQQLIHYYPEFSTKITEPITPGVMTRELRKAHHVPVDRGVIGFVGKEWKRKGLVKAVEIVKQLRNFRPNLKFVVVGPEARSIKHLFYDWQDGYVLKGWQEQADYTEFDVLLHPAQSEPYGMVISEAMATRVPVIISDVCGSAPHVTSDSGQVLSLGTPIDDWVRALEYQLSRTKAVPQFQRSWYSVALEYESRWRSMNDSVNNANDKELDITGVYFTR
jgi:UDP-glucose:(heptosyl)LPS alpha-1,3-glucosyltransferase